MVFSHFDFYSQKIKIGLRYNFFPAEAHLSNSSDDRTSLDKKCVLSIFTLDKIKHHIINISIISAESFSHISIFLDSKIELLSKN